MSYTLTLLACDSHLMTAVYNEIRAGNFWATLALAYKHDASKAWQRTAEGEGREREGEGGLAASKCVCGYAYLTCGGEGREGEGTPYFHLSRKVTGSGSSRIPFSRRVVCSPQFAVALTPSDLTRGSIAK